jgi:hypothetical protein
MTATAASSYGIPRADMLPPVSIDFSPVPSTTNPLGAKGVGEGGTVASTPGDEQYSTPYGCIGVTDLPCATAKRLVRDPPINTLRLSRPYRQHRGVSLKSNHLVSRRITITYQRRVGGFDLGVDTV